MKRNTKIILGIVATVLVGGGLFWFLRRKKKRTWHISSLYNRSYAKSDKDQKKNTLKDGQVAITLMKPMPKDWNTDINSPSFKSTIGTDSKPNIGEYLIGDTIKISNTNPLLDGQYRVDNISLTKEDGDINYIVISSDYIPQELGSTALKKKDEKYDRNYANKGKVTLVKRTKEGDAKINRTKSSLFIGDEGEIQPEN